MNFSTDADGILKVTLDRPPVNAMAMEDLEKFLSCTREAIDGGADGILITGSNGAFCAGLDRETLDSDTFPAAINLLRELIKLLALSPIPIACAVDGHCHGAGMALLLTSDHRVAADADYQFSFPETRLGLSMSRNMFRMLERSTGAVLAQKMTVESMPLKPVQALEASLIDRIAPPGETENAAKSMLMEVLMLPREIMLEARRIARYALHQLYGG